MNNIVTPQSVET